MIGIKKFLSLMIRVAVSASLLYLLFKINKIDLNVLAADIKEADKKLLCAGLLLQVIPYSLSFLRWRMLLEAAGVSASLKKMLSCFAGGIFFSIFLPSTIGGDLVRGADMAQHTNKAKPVVASILLDRLSGYVGMVLVVLLALLLGANLVADKVVLVSVGVLVILLALILLILFNTAIYRGISGFLSAPGAGKIKETLKNMHREIHIFRNQKRVLVFSLIISFFVQLAGPLCTYFIALSLGIKISFIYFIIFLPIISAITLLPIAISGIGLRESLFVVYFAKAGVAQNLSVAMSLLSFTFVVVFAAAGGLFYVFTVHHRRLQSHKPSGV